MVGTGMSNITETAEIDMPDRMSPMKSGYKCIGFSRSNLCRVLYGDFMETRTAVIAYLQMLLDTWESLSDAERRDAVALALDAARRGPPL